MRRYADGIVRRWDAEVSTAASVPSMSSPSKPLTHRSRSYDPHHQAFSVPFAIAMTLSAASSKLSNARSGNPLSRIYSHVAKLAADSTSVSQLKPSTPETELCFQKSTHHLLPKPFIRAPQSDYHRNFQLQILESQDYPFGNHIGSREATEDVDKDNSDAWVGRDDFEGGFDGKSCGFATCVEEVGGVAAMVHQGIDGVHGEAGAVD
jgi:hypothetical protein